MVTSFDVFFMVTRRLLSALILAHFLMLLSACPSREKIGAEGGARFRAEGDLFSISLDDGTSWQPFWAKGVNLAIATPGHLPGELFASLSDYERWLGYLAEINCNVVRAYTLHHPPFYAALSEWNQAHPEQPIYLVQGIWLDELEEGDYMTDSSGQLLEEIIYVVDAIHGEADIPERRGKASGIYRYDVSNYVMGWLPGHEMDGTMVKESLKQWASYTRYDGRYISLSDGLPIEAWVARGLDAVVTYELEKYGAARPVAWSNWPALDPIHHPTETNRYGQDVVDVDFGRFDTHDPFTAGLFVSYHIYPFNPEFIIYDPQYSATLDEQGKPNSYLGYLVDLKARHQGRPLFVTEYGLPSSFGVAHMNDTAYHHGGYTEQEQATHVVDLLQSIVAAGGAGAVVFELIDEWFKRTWLTNPTTLPEDRARLWYDVINPEESFGLMAYYPLADSVSVDGQVEDWEQTGQVLATQPPAPLSSLGDGKDEGRTLVGLSAAADPAFLSLRLDTAGSGLPELEHAVWLIGLSTVPGRTGDTRTTPLGLTLPAEQGLEALVVLDQQGGTFELRIDEPYDPSRRLNGEAKTGGYPEANGQGQYILSSLIINNDEAYISAGKAVIPEVKRYQPGLLRRCQSATDTLCHFQLGAGVLELRLPWHALWVTDPSSRQVLADDAASEGFDAVETSGVTLVVAVAAHTDQGLQLVDVLPRSAFAPGGWSNQDLPFFTWEKWDEPPLTTERPKPLYHALGQAYGAIP